MNPRNLICWAATLGAVVGLMLWGNWSPIVVERGNRTAWSEIWRNVERAPVPRVGSKNAPAPAQRPPPPDLPPVKPHEEAVAVLKMQLPDEHPHLIPLLRRSVRLSAIPVDSYDELPNGASRFTAPLDLPPSLPWPEYEQTPLTPLAQIKLSDIAQYDDDALLPKTGWLCFFYAAGMERPPTGYKPQERGAWRVLYFDQEASTLQRRPPPKSVKLRFPPCKVRYWPEWNLPAADSEPIERIFKWSRVGQPIYADLAAALGGEFQEPGRHHLLGYAQAAPDYSECMAELASQGTEVRLDQNADELKAQAPNAGQWRLLLQIDLDALTLLDAPPEAFEWAPGGGAERLWFWIKDADLQARDFGKVWLLRYPYFEDVFSEDENEDEDGADMPTPAP